MSLLIDALKQAEAARAQAQSATAPPAPAGIELEPLAATNNNSSPQASESAQTPPVRTPATESRRARPATRPAGNASSDAARALFEVKQPGPNRLPIILAVAAGVLFLAGAGYVWWAIQPRSSLIAPSLNVAAASPSAPVISPQNSIVITPATPATIDNSSSPYTQTNQAKAPDAAAVKAPATQNERRDSFRTRNVANKRSPVAVASEDAQAQIRGGMNLPAETRDSNGIQAAYAAFLAGNYSLARQRYQDVLRQDPHNIDAMNALGMIAWRSGQPDVAERMFRAAAHADPKDITAMSQLALLYAEGDPAAAESRLRTLIASQPTAGVAYYALGSLLARQERWNEAQQTLFQAYTLDSDNPDVLFNLAVSLEHVAQASVARQFYERALLAAARRPAGFDKSVAQGRIQALGNR